MAGTTLMEPSVEAMPVRTRSAPPILRIASASTSEVAGASEPWIASSLTCTPLSAPIRSALRMASAACSGPTVRTVTEDSPSAACAIFSASSTAYSSSSDSRPSTPTRSVVLSASVNVRSDWASGTYLTQTTMFMTRASSSVGSGGSLGRAILAAPARHLQGPGAARPDGPMLPIGSLGAEGGRG